MEMMTKYKKYWIGECIDAGETINLEVGRKYLLKDVKGDKKHFYVSKHISNNDAFIGAYSWRYFKIIEDVTEAIQNLPYEEGVLKYDINVGMVRMVARERGISIEEAQELLIKEGKLKSHVVDTEGNPLKKPITIYGPEEVKKFVPSEKPKPENVEEIKSEKKESKAEKKESKQQQTPKLVQKGLFDLFNKN
jgi:hypothetical protein